MFFLLCFIFLVNILFNFPIGTTPPFVFAASLLAVVSFGIITVMSFEEKK